MLSLMVFGEKITTKDIIKEFEKEKAKLGKVRLITIW